MMNVYGDAPMQSKREANSNADKMVIRPNLVLFGVKPTPEAVADAS
jgi:hypothetical protein